MHIFYDPNISKEHKEFILSEDESRHACKVLRMKEGDELLLLNGKGDEFSARITEANPKKCRVKIIGSEHEAPPSFSVHIAIAPTKNNDRLEWFVEKATELGITELSLLLCSNSERRQLKEERLEKILISAMKQSKRRYLPLLNALVPYHNFIDQHQNGLIAYCGEVEKTTIQEGLRPIGCPILIGPEGDFSPAEVTLALSKGYKAISLGKNRLRTETAALSACIQAVMTLED